MYSSCTLCTYVHPFLYTSDDHWLEVSSEELDSLLAEYSSKSMEQVNTAESSHLDSLVHGMKVFVDKVSSHEGAEFPQ